LEWKVQYSQTANEFLAKMDNKQAEIIFRKINSTKLNPHHFFEKMVSLPFYKIRIGDYRVIADLKEQVQIIAVIKIGHRKKVYKEME